ncbi:right-handed parallel beta-helix repeat-containing protein [Flavisolibacter sp. BT320]|nr:right-handed parallel beta-helix repeat-containing protein [Flavisolibacter longurius]
MKLYLLLILSFFTYSGFSQAFVTRDIKSFGAKGDGKTNDHEAFQKAAAFFNARSGNGKLQIPKGIYIIGKQEYNTKDSSKPVYEGSNTLGFNKVSNFTVEGVEGTVLRYRKGLKFGAFSPGSGKPFLHGKNYFVNRGNLAWIGNALYFTNCNKITITNLELDGNSDGIVLGGVFGDVGYQVQHNGIYIINSKKITIQNIKAHHFGLDGIQVSNETGENKEPDAILLKNCEFSYNARQGLSWVGGNSLDAINCKFNHTGRGKFFSMPGAGVDIEAEVGIIKNGNFISCEFINNVGTGLVADTGPSSDCTFSNCIFWGVTNWSIWINKPGFKVIDSKIYGSFVHGFDAKTNQQATVFINCLFEDKPYQGKEPYGTFLIETNYKRRVRFENCTMIAHKKKIVWMGSDPAWKPEEKYQLYNCRLVFMGGIYPEGNWVSITRNIRYKNCTFEIYHPKGESFYFNGIGENYNVDLGGNKFFINKKEITY